MAVQTLGTVRRALRVVDFLTEADAPAPIRSIASACELTLPSAYHIVNTLAADGWLVRDPAGCWGIGPKAARLGEAYERSWPVLAALRGIVSDLGARTNENAYLALVHGRDVVITEIVESRKRIRVHALHRGYSTDLHARALGKAVLAHRPPEDVRAYLADHPPRACTARTLCSLEAIEAELARVRRRGYAEDHEEFAEGVCCLGAPIFAADGSPYGAVSVSVPAFRFRAVRAAVRDAVLAAARAACGVLDPAVPRSATLG